MWAATARNVQPQLWHLESENEAWLALLLNKKEYADLSSQSPQTRGKRAFQHQDNYLPRGLTNGDLAEHPKTRRAKTREQALTFAWEAFFGPNSLKMLDS
jgi:hypothetical protein